MFLRALVGAPFAAPALQRLIAGSLVSVSPAAEAAFPLPVITDAVTGLGSDAISSQEAVTSLLAARYGACDLTKERLSSDEFFALKVYEKSPTLRAALSVKP